MIRRPRSSPLFPYTTLFGSVPADVRGRRAQGLDEARRHRRRLHGLCGEVQLDPVTAPVGGEETALRVKPRLAVARRSEEHTSELQSLAYLVCRLLLEKKKKD